MANYLWAILWLITLRRAVWPGRDGNWWHGVLHSEPVERNPDLTVLGMYSCRLVQKRKRDKAAVSPGNERWMVFLSGNSNDYPFHVNGTSHFKNEVLSLLGTSHNISMTKIIEMSQACMLILVSKCNQRRETHGNGVCWKCPFLLPHL